MAGLVLAVNGLLFRDGAGAMEIGLNSDHTCINLGDQRPIPTDFILKSGPDIAPC